MKIITAISAVSLLALGGCATCQNHPVYCAVGTALVVGSVAATVAANSSDHNRTYDLNNRGPAVRP
jgi:hypothetical protein